MSNYWLNYRADQSSQINAENSVISFLVEGKKLMWLDKQGVHFDPDAPADEFAKKICEMLKKSFKF